VRGSAFNSFNDIARIVGVAALLSVSPARSFAQEAPCPFGEPVARAVGRQDLV
jgi:hypothetical protein